MKRVCILFLNAKSAFSSSKDAAIGGAQLQLVNIARALIASKKYHVSFLTSDWGQKKIFYSHHIKVIATVKMGGSIIYFPNAVLKIWNHLKKVNADVYITSASGPETGIVGLFCLIYHRKLIFRSAHQDDCTKCCRTNLGFIKYIFYPRIIFSVFQIFYIALICICFPFK